MQRKFIITLLIFLFALSGCAPSLIKKAPPDTNIASLGENVLVFGRIRWFDNEKEKERVTALQALRIEDMKKGTIKVERVGYDGRFFAVLPRGTYIVHQLDWFDIWDGPHWLVPKVAFQVADDQQAYYLGTLVINIRTKRNIIGGLRVKGWEINIEDEGNEMMEVFRKRYPDHEIKVAKALMVHDPSIPRIEELENKRVLLDVLRALSFGVMPMISP
ncbi:MAG: hypothetical protein V3W31_06180 [Thermodesulfobacteriota bacterium]